MFMDFTRLIQPLSISNYVLFGLIFYANYLFVLPRFFNKKKYFLMIVCWILLSLFFVFLRYLVQEYLLLKLWNICNFCDVTIPSYIVSNFFQSLNFLIMGGTIIWFIDNWLVIKKQQLLLQQEKFAAEKAFIQSQVSPHFLFNTLNNIYSMVFHQSDQALPAIQKLSGIMRYAIREYREEGVALDTELNYLKNYIALQKLRVKNPAIAYEETGDFTNKTIAPMLLVSFVENAFKHGIINDPQNPLLIHLSIEKKGLTLFVKNKINRNIDEQSSGIGHYNVKKRLEIYYAGKYDLSIINDDVYYTTKLTLQW
jgi:two-component system LytT family sensor kinase